MSDDLNLAVYAAKKAGEVILSYYKSEYEIKEKGYHNPVTTADKEADNILKNILMNKRPNYGWLSEETVDSKIRLKKDKVWIVDPLDGTKEFIEGVPNFVVSIGLVQNKIPILGVLYNPVTDELFSAKKNLGAHLNSSKIRCGKNKPFSELIMLNSRSESKRGLWDLYKNSFKKLRPIGSVAYKLGLVAAKKGDVFATLRPKNEWDVCAGICIINESGGTSINLDGSKIIFNQEDTLIAPGIISGSRNYVNNTIKILSRE